MFIRLVFITGFAALTACSGGGTPSSPVPKPTSTPTITTCHGWAVGDGPSVPITVTESETSDATMSAIHTESHRAPGPLRVWPTTIRLSPAHRQQRMHIAQRHFTGNFAITFDRCGASAPSVRFYPPSAQGPHATAVLSLP